ncbi:MAG: hypothetical protein JW746_09660 [Candidatus Krumholzibacteriota bacterium]|nr:hypothetical protein [Candidatus Krumholzibacteriota bacterium]
MAGKVKIIRARDFLNIDADGILDFEMSKEILIKIALAKKPPADFEVLIDLRDAELDLSTMDVWYLVDELGKHHEAFQRKMALLTSSGSAFDRVEFFETCAVNRGFEVEAFTDFEEAINWLFPAEEI